MAIEKRNDQVMPFLVRDVALDISLQELVGLAKQSTKTGNVPGFSLDEGQFVTDSRMFATLVNHYW